MPSSVDPPRYGLVLPVKPPAVAKSRLLGLGDQARRDLVVAFAADTLTAALECPVVEVVLVVTDDFALAGGMSALGAEVIPDGTVDDLNGSLVQAVAELDRRRPGTRVAALCADLPALRPAELTRALGAADEHRQSFVTDTQGVGTTMLVAPNSEVFLPRFGSGSRAAHLSEGAYEIDLPDIATVRRDVDTPADLADAMLLGVGARTSMVTTGIRL
ncbi:MAG TPA: 2-phospho-L-lactate guanylyltransferase [Nocardioidaceae bacterium]|jgi:2-phospho-L-lactate guanylyltransferase|nr:2-phospho-L-lactate guanylyltransferase [Nocardioidaceae bacterium]